MALMVTALIAGFKPGTSPPPVKIAMVPFFVLIFAIVTPLSLFCGRCLLEKGSPFDSCDHQKKTKSDLGPSLIPFATISNAREILTYIKHRNLGIF
jgi:hypothetical protein